LAIIPLANTQMVAMKR